MLEKLAKASEISREEWLNYRRNGIGGSEAAIVVGLNRFGSPLQLWASKMGIGTEPEETEVMRQGTDFEEYVARRWMEATGKKVRRRNYIFRNTDYPHSIADIDREIIGENAGLECKTTSVYNKSDFESGEIPPYLLRSVSALHGRDGLRPDVFSGAGAQQGVLPFLH